MDVNAAEGGHLPKLFAKDLAGRLVEEAFTVHDAGDAVIDGIAGVGWDFDSGFTHGTQEIRSTQNQQLTQPFSACPCYGPHHPADAQMKSKDDMGRTSEARDARLSVP